MELCARANNSELTIGIPQYGILRHFEHDGPGCIVDVTGDSFASKQTLSHLIDGLVKDGLLSRSENSSDRRKVEVSITAEGRESLLKFEAVQVGLLHRLLEGVSDAELQKLAEGLEALNETLTAARNRGELMQTARSHSSQSEAAAR
jgi:DNA-binding MarR family transcriptional regulator